MDFKIKLGATGILVAGMMAAAPAVARDRIQIVGSSTVFPYTQAVSEEFSQSTGSPAPVVESTGTGGGMKIFCQGVGERFPDMTGASRAMKSSEWELCNKNGVTDISEALIGYDGLSIAVSIDSQTDWNLTEEQLFLALSHDVPIDGKLVANPYKKWSDIDPGLPDVAIQVFGPPPTSGTRDAFVELAMHDGCQALPFVQAKKSELEKSDFKKFVNENCSRMRQDGLFIEAGENDNLIVQRLQSDSDALGIFGYSFLYENEDTLKAVKVNGVAPDFASIADGSYDIARPLFFYVKNAHRGVIPGLNEFLAEYVSEAAFGADGYLPERGLTPLSDEKREEVRDAILQAIGMTRYTN
ncbi:MAG: substrate-binding domain-containing protein [Fimbriimonadaceae bacterium]|nr:substrate-binding domain-containing protein [Alphaproteobacteria bacterium]